MGYKRNHSGESFMVCAAFGARKKLKICLAPNKINTDFAGELYVDYFTFKQDNALNHVARCRMFFNHAIYNYWNDHPYVPTLTRLRTSG